jgi:beta-phosphoglucomutase-like phosphatase (HAD superfamily)
VKAVRKFKAIICDMDGVVVNSEPCHERAFLEVFHALGFRETHGVDFPAYYGKSDRTLWRDFIEKHQPAHSL